MAGKTGENIRNLKIAFNKGGTGGVSGKATIPTVWLRRMDLTPENREIIAEFDPDKKVITISTRFFDDK